METRLAQPGEPQALAKLTLRGLGPAPDGKYRHWDTFRHAPPLPDEPVERQWLVVKLARMGLYRTLTLTDASGTPFRFGLPPLLLEYVHRIDRDATGAIKGASQVTDLATRDTYLFKSLVEEAISSSQLEGASTTRKVAKAMIQEGREPRDRSERMILNNYKAMRFIRDIKDEPLTPERVFAIQRIVTEGTLDEPDAAGRFRRADEPIVIEDETGTLLHTPPPAAQLDERLRLMCAFANGDGDGEFIPPPVRAILLHFWLAYDHPFVDGNGRTARALFYWSMAHQGYWLSEFLVISRILKRARGAYARAYLYTETDDNDATYFVLHQLRVLCRAIDELHDFLARKAAELERMAGLVQRARSIRGELNARQLALLHHALTRPDAVYTVDSHRRSHGVTYETARTDLLKLHSAKLLLIRKVGRLSQFLPSPDLRERMERRVSEASRRPAKHK
jgi:Fic family protein